MIASTMSEYVKSEFKFLFCALQKNKKYMHRKKKEQHTPVGEDVGPASGVCVGVGVVVCVGSAVVGSAVTGASVGGPM